MTPEPADSTFYFRAATPEGSLYSGSVRASSFGAAAAQLVERGYKPLRLADSPLRRSWLHYEIGPSSQRVLGLADCERICRELALLLNVAVPVADALRIVADSARKNSRVARFLFGLRHAMRLGQPLSTALENSGYSLPANLVPIVRAGEQAGSLSSALTLLSENYAESLRFRRAVSSALAYPVLLVVVSIFVFGLMAFFVAPSLRSLFISLDKPVPVAIDILGAVASLTPSNMTLGALIAAFMLLGLWIGGPKAMLGPAKRIATALPLVGRAMKWSATRHFSATLRLYLMNGLSIAVALPGALSSAGFATDLRRLEAVTIDVRSGSQLATALQKSRLFPEQFIHTLAVGESGGRIPDVLASAIVDARSKVEQRIALVSSLLSPILILIIGSLIGVVIFSVFSSLLQVNELVS